MNDLVWHLEKIPYFLAVVEQGSIRKAAEKLLIAQPSLSKSIQLLEVACGSKLFDRKTTGITLTPEGEAFYLTARDIVRSVSLFTENLQSVRQDRTLRLATHEILVPLLFPVLPRNLKKEGVSFKVHTEPSVRSLQEKILNFEADLGVMASSPRMHGIQQVTLFNDRYVLFCSADYLKAHRGETIAHFSELPLVYMPEVLAGPGETMEDFFRKKGLTPRPKHVVGSIESAVTLVASGEGVGFLPEQIARFLTRKKLVPYPAPPGTPNLSSLDFSFCCRTTSWKSDSLIKEIYRTLLAIFPRRT